MTTMSIPEVLEACADKWESGQWALGKGSYRSSDDQAGEGIAVCSVGGIREMLAGNELLYDAALCGEDTRSGGIVVTYLASKLPKVYVNGPFLHSIDRVVNWNDDASRTKEEVIELFKQTAKDFRNELRRRQWVTRSLTFPLRNS